MKKILALCLALCMMLSVSLVAFAAEVPTDTAEQPETSVSEAVVRNKDYYTYPDQYLDGYKVVEVTPGKGEALKMHVFLRNGAIKVWVKPKGGLFYSQKANWTDYGHHYVDLVPNTSGETYQVRIFGTAAWFEGGIYSGN